MGGQARIGFVLVIRLPRRLGQQEPMDAMHRDCRQSGCILSFPKMVLTHQAGAHGYSMPLAVDFTTGVCVALSGSVVSSSL